MHQSQPQTTKSDEESFTDTIINYSNETVVDNDNDVDKPLTYLKNNLCYPDFKSM